MYNKEQHQFVRICFQNQHIAVGKAVAISTGYLPRAAQILRFPPVRAIQLYLNKMGSHFGLPEVIERVALAPTVGKIAAQRNREKSTTDESKKPKYMLYFHTYLFLIHLHQAVNQPDAASDSISTRCPKQY